MRSRLSFCAALLVLVGATTMTPLAAQVPDASRMLREAAARESRGDFDGAVGVLVSLSKKIRESGGALRLAGLNEDLRTLFELTKLDTLFQIADTRARAIGEF